jgi:hypothetical protein
MSKNKKNCNYKVAICISNYRNTLSNSKRLKKY